MTYIHQVIKVRDNLGQLVRKTKHAKPTLTAPICRCAPSTLQPDEPATLSME